ALKLPALCFMPDAISALHRCIPEPVLRPGTSDKELQLMLATAGTPNGAVEDLEFHEAQQALHDLALDIRIPMRTHMSLSQLMQVEPDTMRAGVDVCFFEDSTFVVPELALLILE
ncbi:unnamed protein product, partial [Prorocentrum cordatum]